MVRSLVVKTILSYKYLFIAHASTSLIALICVCHTRLHNWSTPSCYSCTAVKTILTVKLMTFTALKTLVSLTTCFITKATSVHSKLHYISKYSKLVQLVKYHVSVIYRPQGRDTQTHTQTPMLQTKAILRNQACAGTCLV